MAIKFQNPCFISSRPPRIHFLVHKIVDLNDLLNVRLRHKCHMRKFLWHYGGHNQHSMWLELGECYPNFSKARRRARFAPLASADEEVTVNGTPQASSGSDMEEMRVKLNQSLQGKDYSDGLIQSLHDAARVFELALKGQSSLSKISWFSIAWLAADKNAWLKALSYQASVYSLLQAACEISSRGDERDKDVNVFVQRSLLRQSATLESLIREELSAKQPEASEWFWSEQIPTVVNSFINYFERDARFVAATTVSRAGQSMNSGNASDISIVILALTSIASILKLGPSKVCCSQFFSMIPDVTGKLMDMLADLVPIRQAYYYMKDVGLCREFLSHFGSRASSCSMANDFGKEEVAFWIELAQEQLQQAIDRERIWCRLTTCESIEVLEKDLAIFGFFTALGRRTKSFLSANGFDVMDDPVESFVRYLIGGSVLYYPQLSSISSYQFYVEVVCEELEWLPFYPGNLGMSKPSHHRKGKQERPPNKEAIQQALVVCSYWMKSFIKYSTWVESPSNIKAARFLSKGLNISKECMQELGLLKNEMENFAQHPGEKSPTGTGSLLEKDLDSFEQALESVDEALKRLEELLQELHVSSSTSEKEHLKVACSDLERIRKLKKEAEFLEASFRAKAASLQQGNDDGYSQSSFGMQRGYSKRENGKSSKQVPDWNATDGNIADRMRSKSPGLWSFLKQSSIEKKRPLKVRLDKTEDECLKQASTADLADADSEPNEIHRFELLRHELIELEKRVHRSTNQPENEDVQIAEHSAGFSAEAAGNVLVQIPKKENVFGKSIDKIKEASTDVWQGTQLLAIDVAAALILLRRALIGDELTEKEKKALQRTLTDLASVVPIGFLMLLPVTAVGHAAILAAIQRYLPALIPSTYGPDRLDLLRQLEKVKEMECSDMDPDEFLRQLENPEESSPSMSSSDR